MMYWQLVFGNCGVLQGISQGKGFVNMSTVDVETAHDVCEVHLKLCTTLCVYQQAAQLDKQDDL